VIKTQKRGATLADHAPGPSRGDEQHIARYERLVEGGATTIGIVGRNFLGGGGGWRAAREGGFSPGGEEGGVPDLSALKPIAGRRSARRWHGAAGPQATYLPERHRGQPTAVSVDPGGRAELSRVGEGRAPSWIRIRCSMEPL